MNWPIQLGFCGPTDCCLVLVNPRTGEEKQYGIESRAWQILAAHWDIPKQSGTLPDWLGKRTWEELDEDVFNEDKD